MNASGAKPHPTLSIEGLAVRRGERSLFEGVGFTGSPGSVTLIRGANGAGKSSLLLAIAGMLHPAAGTIRYGGDEDSLGRNLHFVGHQTGVKTRLTLGENLMFWASVFGGNGISTEAALDCVGLGGLGGLDAGYLSAGQTRRLALARLLVAHRPVWLLDEPTSALDAEGDGMVERHIASHAAAGGIIVVATHDDLNLAGNVQTISLGVA